MEYTVDYYSKATSNSAERMGFAGMMALVGSEDFEAKYREIVALRGDKEAFAKAKRGLPAWTPMGRSESGKRRASDMVPTPVFMVDIDHVDNPRERYAEVFGEVPGDLYAVHVTPSGKGLRLIVRYTEDFPTIGQHISHFAERWGLDRVGDVDMACRDMSRMSFLVPGSEWLFCREAGEWDALNGVPVPVTNGLAETAVEEPETVEEDYSSFTYKGHLMTEILDHYVRDKGVPEEGERHNFYNELVKNFRNICNNDPRILVSVLPRFGHSYEECMSQCRSITRRNDNSKMPKDFFMWLLRNGYYPARDDGKTEDEKAEIRDEYMTFLSEAVRRMPTPPPVIRDFVNMAPVDFRIAVIDALLPIMGTLTSYLRADYFDGMEHSTSFFSVIYAPAGHGKSFPTRIIPLLWKRFAPRDRISEMRESIYNAVVNGGDDEAKKKARNPNVSVRKVGSIISQPELLTKMKDNHGYHMFTYEAEIDTWKKGSKAAHSDKSDMIRVAWDNGEYGQNFKSPNTFKGSVNLYWNVLITGTDNAMRKYFQNIEDGLVTRCSFANLGDQRFAKAQVWKSLSPKALQAIDKFVDRCDANTYEEPLDYDIRELDMVDEKEFDKVVPWRYSFRPFQKVDMGWIFPRLLEWLEEQRLYSSATLDDARDTFRRRTAVKGFRFALMCTALYEKVTKQQEESIWKFVKWWMDVDLENSLHLFSEEYNRLMTEKDVPTSKRANLLVQLPDEFDKEELVKKSKQFNVKSSARLILFYWRKNGFIREEFIDGKKMYIKMRK